MQHKENQRPAMPRMWRNQGLLLSVPRGTAKKLSAESCSDLRGCGLHTFYAAVFLPEASKRRRAAKGDLYTVLYVCRYCGNSGSVDDKNCEIDFVNCITREEI